MRSICLLVRAVFFISLPFCGCQGLNYLFIILRFLSIHHCSSFRPKAMYFHCQFTLICSKCETLVIRSVVKHGQNTLGPLMMLTHQVQCLCSLSLKRQPISGSKLDLLSFLNFPWGCMILLPNKHNGDSLSSLRIAQILESNCLKTRKLIEQRAEILFV